MNGHQEEYVSRVIVDVPQEKAKTYLCKLRIGKEVSERGMVPVNRMILVYIMKDSLSVNLRCGDHLNFYTRISTSEREVIPGEFDYAAYLFRQQISGTAVIFPGYWQWTGKKSALTWKQRQVYGGRKYWIIIGNGGSREMNLPYCPL